MSSSPSTPDDPGLFDDLPLHSEEPLSQVGPPPAPPKAQPSRSKTLEGETDREALPPKEPLLLFQEESKDTADTPQPEPRPKVAESQPTQEIPDMARARLLSGLADLGVVVAVAISSIVCVAWMGVDLAWLPWAPMALFLAAFSFLYIVFPLAFWGRTPGMACLGLRARGRDGQSLSFAQTVWRWLAGLLSVATFGLPLILTLKGIYLSDVLSKSRVEDSGA